MAGATTSTSCSCATPMCSTALDSVDSGLPSLREQISDDTAARQRRECKGRDEVLCGVRKDNLNLVCSALERARQFRRFVCGNPSAHAKDDPHRGGVGYSATGSPSRMISV